MKRLLQLLCLLAAAALLPAALLVSRCLPADSHPYVEKKYAGWSGVLRAWVCAEWECGGSFTRWLNGCAAEFEKSHDGVYIEFTPVSADALRGTGENGIRPPELILFSPGTLDDPSQLAPLPAPDALRSELRDIGGGVACPVAMGGYIRVYNRQLVGGAPSPGDPVALPADDGARSFSAAAVALLSGAPADEATGEEEAPEIGLDLGLPASADANASGLTVAEDALDRFIDGELPALAITQAELARLIRLRDAGRGPDWSCAASGRVAYTDQLLFAGLVAQEGDGAEDRLALAEEFVTFLLGPDAQQALASIGAFSVTGERIHDGLSPYAEMDALLNGRELLVADPWSTPPDCGALLRELTAGTVDAGQALALLRSSLHESPRPN